MDHEHNEHNTEPNIDPDPLNLSGDIEKVQGAVAALREFTGYMNSLSDALKGLAGALEHVKKLHQMQQQFDLARYKLMQQAQGKVVKGDVIN
jgi:hypothetical protein